MRLEDKTAPDTGAGRGFGSAIAEAFAAEGARVRVSDLGPRPEGVAAGAGDDAHRLTPDMRQPSDWRAAEQAILGARDLETITLDDWRAVLAANLEGAVLGCPMAIRAMRPGWSGSIVNIASRSGHVGIPAGSSHAAPKAPFPDHRCSVALRCAERDLGIRCNSTSPAATPTPRWEPMLGDGPGRDIRMAELIDAMSLRRSGEPAGVALAVPLASDEARYGTGADLPLDVGLLPGTPARPEVAR